MTAGKPEAVVVDTMVASWLIEDFQPELRAAYRELIGNAKIVLCFQTIAEVRFGALNRDWGEFRTRKMERAIAKFASVQSDDAMSTVYAELRNTCRRIGHPLFQKDHDGDRWIAASAIRLNIPVVSHDGIFKNVPGLELITTLDTAQ